MKRLGWVLGIVAVAVLGLAVLRMTAPPGPEPVDEVGQGTETGGDGVDSEPDSVSSDSRPGNAATDEAVTQDPGLRGADSPRDWTPPPGTVAAWAPVGPGQAVEAFVPDHGSEIEGAVLVALPRDMWSWDVGTRLYLPVPRLDTGYPISVERVESLLAGNRTYIGKLSEDFPLSVVITVGERNVFANFSTPQGSYELAGNRDYGWLMPMENMDQHVDHSQPDYFLPDEVQ